VDSGVDSSPLGANPNFQAITYIVLRLTLESLGLALAPSESTLEVLLQVISMVVVVQIYSVVMSPDPFTLLFLASQCGIG